MSSSDSAADSGVFRCPETGSDLRPEADHLVTRDGGLRYPVRDGIPCFLSGEAIEDDETRRGLEKLNRIASQQGWRQALNEVYGPDADIVKYVTDESRAGFLDLLELDGSKSVLEIGPGLGQFSWIVAKQAKHLYGVEVVEGQAHFAATRCRQEGVHNATFACGGDDCRLPFQNESMDVVLLNLVFEWCSTRNQEESAETGQQRLLAEMHRVLKPGGSLYLMTKNRFALRYLLGKPDEHSFGMRFGSALPRWLHRLALRIKGHARPAGLLHSHDALHAMLMDAGYSEARSFWAVPEMRYPTDYVPTDSKSIRSSRSREDFVQGDSRSTKAIMPWIPSCMVRHFTAGLTFVARKGAGI
ncbi:MAG: methyltransferase domain-containing protein [Deltaproteobacteria bacterium]|nr:methyltransferase domain-containing protein [Deltaproteobacteria bacterium]